MSLGWQASLDELQRRSVTYSAKETRPRKKQARPPRVSLSDPTEHNCWGTSLNAKPCKKKPRLRITKRRVWIAVLEELVGHPVGSLRRYNLDP
jgi:hypothetical protein